MRFLRNKFYSEKKPRPCLKPILVKPICPGWSRVGGLTGQKLRISQAQSDTAQGGEGEGGKFRKNRVKNSLIIPSNGRKGEGNEI